MALILPQAGPIYSQRDFVRRDVALREADRLNHKKNEDIEVGYGRIIIRSPDGNRWVITVDNAGAISATAL